MLGLFPCSRNHRQKGNQNHVVEQNTGKDNQEAEAETIRMTNDRSDLIEGNMGLSCNVFNVVSHGTVYKYCL